MLSTYTTLLRIPGALRFCLGGLIGRIPIASMGLSLVLFVEHQTGLYGVGGVVSGAYVAGQAVGSPFVSRLIDRHGQRRIALPCVTGSLIALVALILLVFAGAPRELWFATAAVSGALAPTVGALVRSRWSHVLDDERSITTAFSLEAALDEVVFIVGPIIAVTIATAVWAPGGVIAAGSLQLIGALVFLSRRDTEPTPHPRPVDGTRKPGLLSLPLVIMLVTPFCAGIIFGTVDVAAIALAEEQGYASLAGLVLALFATGSLLAALLYERVQWKASLASRYAIACALLGVLCAATLLAHSLIALAIILFVVGMGISPLFIAGNALIRELVPAPRLTEALTLFAISCSVGIAAGAAIAGRVIDQFSAHAGFYVTIAGGVLLIICAVLGVGTLRRSRH
ncbi:MFS transporter [Micrococcales bacterium 31B]|nr:MFS transporter [Micrococcales bacterium 31B]